MLPADFISREMCRILTESGCKGLRTRATMEAASK